MTIRGIGSRSSPIVIDDDDDIGQPSPITVNSGSSSSRSVTPPQGSLGMVKAQDPVPANPEEFDRLKNSIGYSILVRMGYKPGLGLGMNLEGVTSPLKACTRSQKIPAGLGASNVWDGSSKIAQCTEETDTTATKPRTIPTTTKHVHETSSSLPKDKTTLARGSSNHESPTVSLPSSNPPAVSSSVDVTSQGVHDDGKRNGDPTKAPSSKSATHLSDTLRIHDVPKTATKRLPPSILFSIPSPVPLRFPFLSDDSHATVPVNPPLNVNSRSIPPVSPPRPSSTPGIPYSPKLRGRIGMLPDEKGVGTRGSFPKQLEPPPRPSCSFVMEILPRKFRTQAFVLEWLSEFSFRPRRYELLDGRVFIEFENERDARLACNSPRMGGKEGLHGVRLFRYIPTTPPTSEQLGNAKEVNATRTITNPTQPQPILNPPGDLTSNGYYEAQAVLPAPHSPQYKLVSPPQQPSTPAPNFEIPVQDPGSVVTSQTKDKTSRSETEMSFSDHLFGNSSSSSSMMTGPWVGPTTSSDLPNGRLVNGNPTTREEPSHGAVGFAPGASVSPTLVSVPMSPASSSTLASSSSSISPSLVPSLTSDSWHTSTVLEDKALSMPSHEDLLMQESQLMEICDPETGAKQAAFTQVDGTRPFANGPMESTDSVALAKELALRQMVLRSRKRKVVTTADSQQPTSDSSAAAARSALEELAVNFISDAISRPPPAKRVKITPSPSALATWGKRLETHIEKSKVIMAEIQGTQSKAEKDRLWAVLREHNRMIDEEKTALFSIAVAEVAVPMSPWPEAHPDGGVLVLSDTDGGDDDDDDDDME
ncbi:hypothetical protein EDB92DRAFT_1849443 [Lactarius akahatsu]|uniref:G-patch domain-containing protein n=1 Tax=Lactarius akahatsu TaxID=416441 RepID=A0AAD4QF15_9AGAM|nr:hypothetical protein EDB92DRAFT_1849443 [Lactarius akahatsu]